MWWLDSGSINSIPHPWEPKGVASAKDTQDYGDVVMEKGEYEAPQLKDVITKEACTKEV